MSLFEKFNKKLKEADDLEASKSGDAIQIYMNTWKNYNDFGADLSQYGIDSIANGWMSVDDAIAFYKAHENDEPFINDTDNAPWEINEYSNALQELEKLKKFEELDSYDQTIVKNMMETGYFGDNEFEQCLEKLNDGDYTWFEGVSSDYSLGEAWYDMVGGIEGISNPEDYIDEEAYREAIEDDVANMYSEDTGVEDPFDTEHYEDFQNYLDEVVRVDLDTATGSKIFENYFDYEKLGRELGYDGFTFTSDGCINMN